MNARIAQAKKQSESGHPEEARALFKEARVLAQTLSTDARIGPAEALLFVVEAQAAAGFYEDARITLEGFPDDFSRVRALGAVAHYQALHGKKAAAEVTFQQALVMIRNIAVPWPRSLALYEISGYQAEAGFFVEARETAESISDPTLKKRALARVMPSNKE